MNNAFIRLEIELIVFLFLVCLTTLSWQNVFLEYLANQRSQDLEK